MLKLKNYVNETLEKNDFVKFDVMSLTEKEIEFLNDNFELSENNESIFITKKDNFYFETKYGLIKTKEQVKEILEVTDLKEIYIQSYKEAIENNISGNVFCFLDLTDLTIGYEFLRKGTYNQAIDDWYKLVLYKVNTPYSIFDNEDFFTDDEIITFELENFIDLTIEEFYLEKFGEDKMGNRIDEYLDYCSEGFDLEWEYLNEKLEDIYKK